MSATLAQFDASADRYRRQLARVALCAIAGFALAGISLMLPVAAMKWVGIPGCALVALSLLLLFTLPALRCPACQRMSDSAPETYCPACGDGHLRVSKLFGTHCDACDRTMGNYKYRNYPIRFCTHCGVLLAERGV